MEENYRLWLLLHLFLDLLAENGNEDVSIWDYFVFGQALQILLAVFLKSFLLWRITHPLAFNPLIPTPPEMFWQLPSATISFTVIFAYVSLITSANWTTKNCQSKQDVDKVYIRQWTVDNIRTNTMVTLCSKTAQNMFMLSSAQYKKRARRGSVLQVTCGLPVQNEISSQL